MQRGARGFVLVAAISLASCGGATVTESPTSTPSSTPASSPVSGSAIVITRSGGIAGFIDVVEIAPDGSAQVTRKTGETSSCTPTAEALARLRAIDLAAIGTGPPKAPFPDGFTYEVVVGTTSASVADGEAGPRAELLRAAADVVASCLATVQAAS